MVRCNKSKFWLQNPINLVCDTALIPLDNMVFSEQMNAITRLVFLVYLVLYLAGSNFSSLFLLLSLLFIIILYYIQRSQMNESKKEFYTDLNVVSIPDNFKLFHKPDKALAESVYHPKPGIVKDIYNDPQRYFWCDGTKWLESAQAGGEGKGVFNNPDFISPNQKLVGRANPKTQIAPVVAPPPSDLSFWRTNNTVIHSAINDESQIEQYQNGYQVQTCCAPTYNQTIFPVINEEPKDVPLKIYDNIPPSNNLPSSNNPRSVLPSPTPSPTLPSPSRSSNIIENYEGPLQITEIQADEPWILNNDKGGKGGDNHNVQFEYPFLKVAQLPLKSDVVIPNEPGMVDTTCGYDAKQLLNAGLPANLPSGFAQKDSRMMQYNKEIFKQTIQPGVYTTNQVNEPINSNIGISFTQQFEPVISKTNPETGQMYYDQIDPRIINPDYYKEERPKMDMTATEANVYDPRFSGYGTTYRSYTDDLLGQPKYYYDDVDVIRMPNYITRNNIDNQPFADSYGPMKAGDEFGNKYNAQIHALAGNAFVDSNIQFRTELSERLMRKVNSEAWQQRISPIRSGGQRTLGSMALRP